MLRMREKDTGTDLGSLSEEQLAFLQDHMEEESASDTDYYVNRTLLDLWSEQGADADLISRLRTAMGDRDGVEIEWFEA